MVSVVVQDPHGVVAVSDLCCGANPARVTMDGGYTFTKWLLQYQREPTAVGDLARQVARDPEWIDPPTLTVLESQLSGAGSPQATLDVARRAWRRYASDNRPRARS
jgi:hypothetical protein